MRVESVEKGVCDKLVKAKVYIDCTYEGDLMARAGVSYTVGREDSSVYGESWNGAHESYWHQFPDGVDPYVEKGNPESGLLWGISPEGTMPEPGKGDDLVQAYNFRICVTFDKASGTSTAEMSPAGRIKSPSRTMEPSLSKCASSTLESDGDIHFICNEVVITKSSTVVTSFPI